MANGSCTINYKWELDQNFQPSGVEWADKQTKIDILKSIGIPKSDQGKQLESDDDSTDSDSLAFRDTKYNILLDPPCGFPCENDIGWFDIVESRAPWDEENRPYVQVLNYEDLTFTDQEKGHLSGMAASTGLSSLTAVPMDNGFALTKLQLSNRGLTDIQILDNFKYLQYLDISNNSIQDLSPLLEATYLLVLDASHNSISAFRPNPTPWFLTYLNLSFNNFISIPDVSLMWSLKHLNLSNNSIQTIQGIKNLNYLEYLNLSNNEIQIIENISKVPLKKLDLSWNQISHCSEEDGTNGLLGITTLQRLDISHNNIESIDSIECINHTNLRHLNISFNKFNKVTSFDHLAKFKALCYLRLEGNSLIDELPDMVNYIMHLLPQLSYLNGDKLSKKKRISVLNMWNSNPVIDEMKTYCYDLLYSNTEPPPYGIDTPMHLDYDLPLVILVGPPGTRKHEFAQYIANGYPNFVRIPKVHTTMYKCSSHEGICKELTDMALYHVDENTFNRMWNRGKFLFVHTDLGDLFGLSRDELAHDGRLCLIPLPLGPALSLKWQGLNTSMILIQNDKEYSTLLQQYVASKLTIQKQGKMQKEIDAVNRKAVEEDTSTRLSQDDTNVKDIDSVPKTKSLISHTRKSPLGSIRNSREFATSTFNPVEGPQNEHLSSYQPVLPVEKDRSASPRTFRTSPHRREHNSIEKELDSSQIIYNKSVSISSTAPADPTALFANFGSVAMQWSDTSIPSWCDDTSDEDIVKSEPLTPSDVRFIDTLKLAKLEKANLWNIYRDYDDKKATYYEDIEYDHFSQTVTVESMNTALRKILPILVEKYNSSLNRPEKKSYKDDILYRGLVEPTLNEMMEILSGRVKIDRSSLKMGNDLADDGSSSSDKATLSAPFFTPATSSLQVSHSTSLTEFASLERPLEEPHTFWAPESPPTTPSTILEEKARESTAKAVFSYKTI